MKNESAVTVLAAWKPTLTRVLRIVDKHAPYLGAVVRRNCVVLCDTQVDTAQVDSNGTIRINPYFWFGELHDEHSQGSPCNSDQYRATVFAHEVLHFLGAHGPRQANYPKKIQYPRVAAYAQDAAINRVLVDMDLGLPQGAEWPTPPWMDPWPWERIYETIVKQIRSQNQKRRHEPQGPGNAPGTANGTNPLPRPTQPAPNAPRPTQTPQTTPPTNAPPTQRPPGPPGLAPYDLPSIARTAIEYAQTHKQTDRAPLTTDELDAIHALLLAIGHPAVPIILERPEQYRTIVPSLQTTLGYTEIARHFKTFMEIGETHRVQDKRRSTQSECITTTFGETPPRVIICVDVSGSTAKYADRFMSEVQHLLAESPAPIRVIECDDEIKRDVVYQPGETIDRVVCKGCETDLRPPFELLAKEQARPAGLIYLTDLGGPWPGSEREDTKPDYPVIWAVTPDAAQTYLANDAGIRRRRGFPGTIVSL